MEEMAVQVVEKVQARQVILALLLKQVVMVELDTVMLVAPSLAVAVELVLSVPAELAVMAVMVEIMISVQVRL